MEVKITIDAIHEGDQALILVNSDDPEYVFLSINDQHCVVSIDELKIALKKISVKSLQGN